MPFNHSGKSIAFNHGLRVKQLQAIASAVDDFVIREMGWD
ncbi:MAG: hypothetical protein M2R46_05613 [Verrucomicrobia subdivision 3 bacterium]|nr:hypothetical protein [Limisphaerales bacterium]